MMFRFLFLFLFLFPKVEKDVCVEIDEIQIVKFENNEAYYLLKKVFLGNNFSRSKDFMRIKDGEVKRLNDYQCDLDIGYYYLVRQMEDGVQTTEKVFNINDSLGLFEFIKDKVNCNSL